MSLLEGVGNAAESATQKATQNPVGNAIDAVAGGLAGSSASAPSGNALVLEGEPLELEQQASAYSLQSQTKGMPEPKLPLQTAIPLQFLHLCFAHDVRAARFPGGASAQGVAMRDALVREAVLQHSFIRASQAVVQQAQQSKGAAGAMLDTAGSLMGGSSQASAGPEMFDGLLAQVRAAIDPVNQTSVDYPAIHAAGKALAEVADAHQTLCKSALQPGQGGGAGLPSVAGLSSALGGTGVPDIVGKIPEWLFKVQDASLAMYAQTRNHYEWPLMKVCHDYSLEAIRGRWLPSYDIWRLRNQEAIDAAREDDPSVAERVLDSGIDALESKPLTLGGEGYGATDTAAGEKAATSLAKAQEAIEKARHQAQDKAAGLFGMLDTARSAQADMPPESVAALAAACAVLRGDPELKIPPLGRALADGLRAGLGGLPGFMDKWCQLLGGIAAELIEGVLKATHASPSGPNEVVVLAAVHQTLSGKLVGMVFELVMGRKPQANDTSAQQEGARSAIGDAGNLQFGNAMDKAKALVPGKDQAANRAADLLTAFLASQGRHLNGIVFFVAEELCTELQRAWTEAKDCKAMTMEAYIGRVPMMAAMLGRNLIFPVFNLVLEAFGLGDKVAGAVWDPVSQGIGRVTEGAQAVKGVKDDVGQAGRDLNAASQRVDDQLFGDHEDSTQSKLNRGIDQLSSANQDDAADGFQKQGGALKQLEKDAKGTPDDLARAAKGDPPADAAAATAEVSTGTGPLSGVRVADGQAQKVTRSQIDSVERVAAYASDKEFAAKRSEAPPAPPAAPKLGLGGF